MVEPRRVGRTIGHAATSASVEAGPAGATSDASARSPRRRAPRASRPVELGLQVRVRGGGERRVVDDAEAVVAGHGLARSAHEPAVISPSKSPWSGDASHATTSVPPPPCSAISR